MTTLTDVVRIEKIYGKSYPEDTVTVVGQVRDGKLVDLTINKTERYASTVREKVWFRGTALFAIEEALQEFHTEVDHAKDRQLILARAMKGEQTNES